VRYRKPVLLHQQAELRGWIAATTLPLFRMKAELHQDGIVKATAQATFFDRGEP
jgi:acyl-CoA thioesterase FadM